MIKTFLLTLLVFLGFDSVWLGIITKNFYNKHLGSFERAINWPSIAFVYLLIPLGIVFFVLPKANESIKMALLWGAVYGLIVYGVYDLTNMATLKNWSLTMVVADMLWGMFISGVTSLVVTYLTNR